MYFVCFKNLVCLTNGQNACCVGSLIAITEDVMSANYMHYVHVTVYQTKLFCGIEYLKIFKRNTNFDPLGSKTVVITVVVVVVAMWLPG